MNAYQISFLVFACICIVLYVIYRIWGINIFAKIVQTKPVLQAIGSVIETVADILPSKHLTTLLDIQQAASKGAEIAEELWLVGELDKDERNVVARKIAYGVLETQEIELTFQVEAIVNGVIEIVCVLLPHGQKPNIKG